MEMKEAKQSAWSFFLQVILWFSTTASLVLLARGSKGLADGAEAYAGLVILFTFSLATLTVLILSRLQWFMRLYAALVYFAILYGSFFFFVLIWPFPAALVMISLMALMLFFSPRVLTQNLILSIALAGIALQFASLISFTEALVLLFVLAVYDILAVSVTHHMVRMARSVVHAHLPVVFIIPHRASEMHAHVNRFEPGSNAIFFGAGDVALPAVLLATAPTMPVAFGVFIGSLVGIAVLVVTFLRGEEPHPLPALPFIVVGAMLGLSAALFIA